MKNVFDFYMDMELPISTRVCLYSAYTKKLICNDYHKTVGDEFDYMPVVGYRYYRRSKFLMLWVRDN